MANEKFTGQPEIERTRTPFAQTIFRETDKGLYYEIMYYDPADGKIHIGFGSYNPQYVLEWLDEYFAIDKSIETDFQKVMRCRDCQWWNKVGCAIRINCDEDKPTENDFCSFGERRCRCGE